MPVSDPDSRGNPERTAEKGKSFVLGIPILFMAIECKTNQTMTINIYRMQKNHGIKYSTIRFTYNWG